MALVLKSVLSERDRRDAALQTQGFVLKTLSFVLGLPDRSR